MLMHSEQRMWRLIGGVLLPLLLLPIPTLAATARDATDVPRSTGSPSYPIVSIPNTAPTQGDYSQYPVCTNIACKDINGNFPAGTPEGTTENCPPACTVTRTVQTISSGGVTRITNYVPATCPPGYVVGSTYDVGPEIKYSTSPIVSPLPIPDKNTYDNYIAAGYTCGASTNNPGSDTFCQNSYTDPRNQLWWGDSHLDGGNVIWANYCNDRGCYTACGSWAETPGSCSLVTTTRKWTCYWWRAQCVAPAGPVFTANSVPTSLLCIQQKVSWKQ